MKRIIVICSLISIICMVAASSAFPDKTVRYDNAKILGLGNTRVAGGFGYNGFIDNPALLSRVGIVRLSLLNLPLTFSKNFLDIAQFVEENSDKFQRYDELSVQEQTEFIKDIRDYDGKWARFNLAPMIDIAGNIMGCGIGLGVFSSQNINMKLDQGIYEPLVWGGGSSTTAVVLGFAKPVSILLPGLTIGANIKFIQRYRADIFQIPASDLGNIADTTQPIRDEFQESRHNTIAADIGGLLELPFIGSEVAATVQSIGDGRGSSVDLGFAKRMLSDRLTVLADYRDLLDNNKENVFMKIHAGAEYKLLFLAVRAGINSGYPCAGLGLDFRVLDIDTAYYIEELSKGPGGYDEPRFITQVKLGW